MAKKRTKPTTITDQLKAAIADAGLSTYALAKETGIAQPILHRFIAGDRDLKLATVDRLASYLKLQLKRGRG
jgi:predicted transcriptional regulator